MCPIAGGHGGECRLHLATEQIVQSLRHPFVRHVHQIDARHGLARYRVPTIYYNRFFSEQGGLISYGELRVETFRLAAGYIDRIFKGEKPADLPVQAPTKFELIINLKTAKALDLTISRDFLLIADEVIE